MKPFVIAGALVVVFVVLIAVVAWTLMGAAPTPPPQPTGTVSLYVADLPANATWRHVNVTFDRVEVHQNGSGWHNLTLVVPATIDLIPLVSNLSALLAKASVPATNYTQVRFHITSVVGLLRVGVGTCTINLTAVCTVYMSVPSTDIYINKVFRVNDTKQTTLVVDIDLSKSIVQAGATWVFQPVIGTVTVEGPR